jgi:hypothetical protein
MMGGATRPGANPDLLLRGPTGDIGPEPEYRGPL